MKFKTSGILTVLLLVLTLSVQAYASPAKVINSFALRAARELGRSSSSWFFSPYSIVSAFGMAYAGSSGDTAKEIEQALGFTWSLHGELSEFVQDIASTGQVYSANRVWLDKSLGISRNYQDTLYLYYRSTAEALDIKNSPDLSRKVINSWAAEHTNGKIPSLLSELDPDTRMLITNAVYFNAQWQNPFTKSATKPENFRDGEKISQVPMMKMYADFQYGEFDGVKIIRIPYKGRRIYMLAVLPPEGEPALENLDAETLTRWNGSLRKYEVDLWLPKFMTENSYQLSEIFKALGVKQAFTDDADFSRMSEAEKLKIDSVIHKTFIDVDEEKTEAAAVTMIGMVGATAMPDPVPTAEFHADRPFVYFIMDGHTGTILFMGRQTF